MANTHPLRKYLPMNPSSIDNDDIEADSIEAGDIAAGAIAVSELATDALAASVDGRLKMATDYFTAAQVLKAFAAGSFTTANLDSLIADDQFTEALLSNLILAGAFTEALVDTAFAAGAIDGADRIKAASIISDRIVSGTIADDRMASSLVKEPGRVAVGRADFAGVATPGITVTIGTQIYQEAGAEDLPNGVWTDGGTANDSAVSLALAINGDTRAGNLYAAIVLTDTVFIAARALGAAGNASIVVSAGEPVLVEDLIGGADAAVKQQVHIMHTITAAEVAVDGTAPEVIIPLPFDAAFFSWQVYDSTGGIYATEISGHGTVTAAAAPVPAYFKLANADTVDVQAGDIIRLVVQD